MKLLIISQKIDINDDNLGFFHYWLEKFANKLEKVYVVCLSEGKHNLPENVLVYSLGKEKGYSKLRQLLRLQKFLFKNLKEVDGVFVHMCPIYAIASFPLVKIFRKKMILWYLHKSVNWKLKLTEKLVDKILTASEQSCRLKDREKIEIVGHGIDTDLFKTSYDKTSVTSAENKKFKILIVGRIAPIKDHEILIRSVDILVNQKSIQDVKVNIIGSPLEDYEKEYFEKLKSLIQEKKLENYVSFLGGVPYNKMPKHYQVSDLLINLTPTGSFDKVLLEAMASGCLILTCNMGFANILDNKYLFKKKDFQELAEKIIALKEIEKTDKLRKIVIKHHNLDNLIEKIVKCFV